MTDDVRKLQHENERKIKLAVESLLQQAAHKQRNAAWGHVSVKLFWENGQLKLVEINDSTTIK